MSWPKARTCSVGWPATRRRCTSPPIAAATATAMAMETTNRPRRVISSTLLTGGPGGARLDAAATPIGPNLVAARAARPLVAHTVILRLYVSHSIAESRRAARTRYTQIERDTDGGKLGGGSRVRPPRTRRSDGAMSDSTGWARLAATASDPDGPAML